MSRPLRRRPETADGGKPVIFSLDDDPEVLGAVERDLRQHYRSEYRIVKALSGREALEMPIDV